MQVSSLWHTKIDYSEKWLYHALPNAELAILPNGDHQVDRQEPDLFCRVISDYFRRQLA
jgi:pimeloyl-ACP methyl ester carboxylesterase